MGVPVAERSAGPRWVGPRWLFDCLRRPNEDRHHHDAEADNDSDSYGCDFHCCNWLLDVFSVPGWKLRAECSLPRCRSLVRLR